MTKGNMDFINESTEQFKSVLTSMIDIAERTAETDIEKTIRQICRYIFANMSLEVQAVCMQRLAALAEESFDVHVRETVIGTLDDINSLCDSIAKKTNSYVNK